MYHSKKSEIIHPAQYEIGFFLWTRVKLLDVLDKKAIEGYNHIASSLMRSFWVDNAKDEAHHMPYTVGEWLGLLNDTPKMGFEIGAATPLRSYPEIAERRYNQLLEYYAINKPYQETAWFLYEKLATLKQADKATLESWGDLIFAFKEHKASGFDAHLAPGFIDDLYTWIEFYEQSSSEAYTFGKQFRDKYSFFQQPYKNDNYKQRHTHLAVYELNFFLWSRMKLCDVKNIDNLRLYRGISNALWMAYQESKLNNNDFKLMHDLTVAFELLETSPWLGYTVAATISSYDYYETMTRMYNTPVEYIDLEQPIIEIGRFLYEKICSLTPESTPTIKSFNQAVKVLADTGIAALEAKHPGFLPQLLEWLALLERGETDDKMADELRAQYPLLFTTKLSSIN